MCRSFALAAFANLKAPQALLWMQKFEIVARPARRNPACLFRLYLHRLGGPSGDHKFL